MLTLFSIPKPFRGHIGVIQRNAIQSWIRIPGCAVILFGNDDGTAETAAEFGLRHIADVQRNSAGTPLVNDLFGLAEQHACGELLCYVNADIVLLDDFLPAVERVAASLPSFLMIGRRWDMDVTTPLEFVGGWQRALRDGVAARAKLHAHTGLDYFVFRRGLWPSIPAFAIGRCVWDQWLVISARARGIPVVDLTPSTTAVHQNHDYAHHAGGAEGVWKGEEAQRNLALAGGYRNTGTIRDATHVLREAGLRRRLLPYDLARCLVLPLTTHPLARPWIRMIKFCVGRG
jgi:hypothetical protein